MLPCHRSPRFYLLSVVVRYALLCLLDLLDSVVR